ncbi:MAG: hypothetical protein FJ109_16340 [Deltaproteobacteria bacterium]|nr:hypothetical protein [Deltaproteobacteria bacterium]
MRALPIVLIATLLLGACAKKEQAAQTEGKDAWPKGLSAHFDPENRILSIGAKLRMWVENKTGEEFKPEWIHDGSCGQFLYDKAKPFEATFVGGENAEDCTAKLTVKLVGKNGILEKQFNALVKGSAKFKELVLRPDPMPETWIMVNNYDQTFSGREVKCVTVVGGAENKPSVGLAVDADKKRKKTDEESAAEAKAKQEGKQIEVVDIFDGQLLNLLDAPYGPWNFEFSGCAFGDAPEGEKGVLPFAFDLPHDDDYCGYFENLGMGKDCESVPFDARPIDKITFLARSGDAEKHAFFVELVAWEKFAEFHQGRSEPFGPIEAGTEWKRFEVAVADIVKRDIDPSAIKSVSFKVRREPNYPDHGLILFDNIALVKKGEATKTAE